MQMRRFVRGVGLLLVLCAGLGPWRGAGAATLAEDFAARLYAADTAGAAALAESAASTPDDGTAQFALGVARFLGAVEGLLRTLHRHGLQNEYLGPESLSGLPVLRLPVPPNPAPAPVSYADLRAMLERFGAELAGAQQALAAVGDRPVALPLDLMRVRLDATEGPGGEVDLFAVFLAVVGPVQLREDIEEPLRFRFDTADAAWLGAYSHLLMALSDFLLAHDWETAYTATFHGLFPDSFTPATPLASATAELTARLQGLMSAVGQQPDCDPAAPECQQRFAVWEAEQSAAYAEAEWLQIAISGGGIADLVAFLHLMHWPVVEPARMASALGHLEGMVAGSRRTWELVLAETDDEREWLPAPAQTGMLAGGLDIDDTVLAGWNAFLDELGAILKGEKLVAHWRFRQGINLRRMFLEPRTFDAVLLAQGSAAVPYLEDGPLSDSQTWERILQLFGGNFFTYFIWIN
jgi:hypothetical protein